MNAGSTTDASHEVATAPPPLPRASSATPPHRHSGAAWWAVGALALCFLVDSSVGSLIPHGALLRLSVPVLLTLQMLSTGSARRTPAERRAANAVAAFAGAGALSSLLCVAPELGILKLAMYLGVMTPLLLCRPIVDGLLPGADAFRWMRGLLLAALASAAAQVHLGMPGLLTNPNAIAGLAVMTTPMILYGCGSRDQRRRRASYVWLAVAIVTALGSGSRGGSAALLIGVLTYYGLRRTGSWRSVIGLGVVAAVVGAVLMAASEATQEFAYKDHATLLDATRLNSFQENAEAFAERPLLGYGFGLSWRVERSHVATALRTGRLSWFVGEFGNATLAILAGGGVLLLGCFVALLASVLGPAVRSLRGACSRGDRRDFQVALVAGLTAMIVQSQAEAWLMAPMAWPTIAFWIYAGLALRCATLPSGTVARPTSTRPGLPTALEAS